MAAAAAERVQLPAGECFNHRPPRLAALLHPAWLIVLCFQTQSKNKRLTPPSASTSLPSGTKPASNSTASSIRVPCPLLLYIIFYLIAALVILSFFSQLHWPYYLSSHSCICHIIFHLTAVLVRSRRNRQSSHARPSAQPLLPRESHPFFVLKNFVFAVPPHQSAHFNCTLYRT